MSVSSNHLEAAGLSWTKSIVEARASIDPSPPCSITGEEDWEDTTYDTLAKIRESEAVQKAFTAFRKKFSPTAKHKKWADDKLNDDQINDVFDDIFDDVEFEIGTRTEIELSIIEQWEPGEDVDDDVLIKLVRGAIASAREALQSAGTQRWVALIPLDNSLSGLPDLSDFSQFKIVNPGICDTLRSEEAFARLRELLAKNADIGFVSHLCEHSFQSRQDDIESISQGTVPYRPAMVVELGVGPHFGAMRKLRPALRKSLCWIRLVQLAIELESSNYWGESASWGGTSYYQVRVRREFPLACLLIDANGGCVESHLFEPIITPVATGILADMDVAGFPLDSSFVERDRTLGYVPWIEPIVENESVPPYKGDDFRNVWERIASPCRKVLDELDNYPKAKMDGKCEIDRIERAAHIVAACHRRPGEHLEFRCVAAIETLIGFCSPKDKAECFSFCVAVMLAEAGRDRLVAFDQAKRLYDSRSRYVHDGEVREFHSDVRGDREFAFQAFLAVLRGVVSWRQLSLRPGAIKNKNWLGLTFWNHVREAMFCHTSWESKLVAIREDIGSE